jgi:uncharacterized protein
MGESSTRAAAGGEPFVVMAKPVGPLCNLQCGYCYYLETGQHYEAAHLFRMPDSVLESYIRQYIEANPGPLIQFTWHGGEPTLAGLPFFRKAVALQKRFLPAGWTCWNNLQTNGILLDDAWCDFLAKEHFDVGLSLDGTRQLHDEYRKDYGGQGTFERVAAACRRLQAHGIQPDLLCTVTSSIARDPVGVYRSLREFGTGWIQFIPIVRRAADGGMTGDSVGAADYGQFLSDILDEWLYHDIGQLEVQLFAELSLIWSGGEANVCQLAPTCGRVLILEHDGSVYSCDHFVTPEHRLGDLATQTLRQLADSPAQHRFGLAKRDSLPAQCRACDYLNVCRGHCPKDRFILSDAGEPGLNYLCAGLRQFYAHAEKPLRLVGQLRRQGLAPAGIMAALRAEELARWQGIGRNDPCPCGSGRKAKNCCWNKRP